MAMPHENPAFENDDGKEEEGIHYTGVIEDDDRAESVISDGTKERANWGKGIEFLLSCIAMSVGLGNVWRFPFTALENGGGAFLIPYLIVLFLVGKPIYYLEMIIGQFSSRGSVKVYDLCPAMRGIGFGTIYIVFLLGTYYQSLCAIIGRYLFESFKSPLPWAYCRSEWLPFCIDSTPRDRLYEPASNSTTFLNPNIFNKSAVQRNSSSSEWFFVNEVLHEKENINDGLGTPNWELVIGLLVSWLCVFFIVMRGVKSSGKASYFLAIFPYVIMTVLLIRAVTLPGAVDGIIYFIKPKWNKILDPKVWYAAVTQCFYSLSVCFGNIIMYASYNKFRHNVHRDATIVTGLDTCTSLLAGCTIFGILGHLAHEVGTDDIGSVVKGGAGLAFISYPDAIAKFKKLPQVFSVLFFLMLFVLGIGSNIAMTSCTTTAIRDRFPKIKQWQAALGIAVVSYCIGLAYVTPGGQFLLTLVDFYGASMIALILGIFELYVLGWVYGVDRLCRDVEFMLGRKVGLYWRICWSIVTPLIMTVILIYFFATYEQLTYNGVLYPNWAYALGWTISCFGVLQLPIWMIVAIFQQPSGTFSERFMNAFKPKRSWGPANRQLREQYHKEIETEALISENFTVWQHIKRNVIGK